MKNLTLFILLTFLSSFALAQVEPEPGSGMVANKPVYAKQYMVVTAHHLASKAASKIIEQNGSAVDAAIAAQLVLNVVEPQSSGIGGGGFMLYYDAKQKHITSYDGRETAPKAVKPDMFIDENGEAMAFIDAVRSGKAVGTPGLLAMLNKAHKKHGKLAWGELFKPAIKIAKNGFPISKRLNVSIQYASEQNVSEEFRQLYLDESGKAKAAGVILKNPQLAAVLENIANYGASWFYQGEIIGKIVKVTQARGGRLSEEDLNLYKVKQRDAVCSYYRGLKVCAMGLPSSGGITTLQTLGIVENFELKDPFNPKEIHLILEAQKIAFADRNHYLADGDIVKVPSSNIMLDKKYLKQRANQISKSKASNGQAQPGQFYIENGPDASFDAPSTTHLSIVDKDGNAVSLTSSVEHSFGSGIIVDGFILNNQLTDFAFKPQQNGKMVANAVAPGKRPRSSMSPTIILNKDASLYAVLGSPGGSGIIPYVTKTIIGLVDWDMGLQEIINSPHFMHKNTQVELENGQDILSGELLSMGHEVILKKHTSGVNAIIVKNGIITGASDPRREGVAMGF